MEDVASLKVAQQLNSTINQLYEETIQRLEGALQSVCNDFHANQYVKVRHRIHIINGGLSHLRSCNVGTVYYAWLQHCDDGTCTVRCTHIKGTVSQARLQRLCSSVSISHLQQLPLSPLCLAMTPWLSTRETETNGQKQLAMQRNSTRLRLITSFSAPNSM